MSVIIRLQNLSWSAQAADIRRFFSGLYIPEGGVHIVGGDLGDAFITFAGDEDARLALRLEGQELCGSVVKLFVSSPAEMQQVVVRAQQAVAAAAVAAAAATQQPPPQQQQQASSHGPSAAQPSAPSNYHNQQHHQYPQHHQSQGGQPFRGQPAQTSPHQLQHQQQNQIPDQAVSGYPPEKRSRGPADPYGSYHQQPEQFQGHQGDELSAGSGNLYGQRGRGGTPRDGPRRNQQQQQYYENNGGTNHFDNDKRQPPGERVAEYNESTGFGVESRRPPPPRGGGSGRPPLQQQRGGYGPSSDAEGYRGEGRQYEGEVEDPGAPAGRYRGGFSGPPRGRGGGAGRGVARPPPIEPQPPQHGRGRGGIGRGFGSSSHGQNQPRPPPPHEQQRSSLAQPPWRQPSNRDQEDPEQPPTHLPPRYEQPRGSFERPSRQYPGRNDDPSGQSGYKEQQSFRQASESYEKPSRQPPLGNAPPPNLIGDDKTFRQHPTSFDQRSLQSLSGFDQPSHQPPSGFEQSSLKPQSDFDQPSPTFDQPYQEPPAAYDHVPREPSTSFEKPSRQPPGYYQQARHPPVGYEQPSGQSTGYDQPARQPLSYEQPFRQPSAGHDQRPRRPPVCHDQPSRQPTEAFAQQPSRQPPVGFDKQLSPSQAGYDELPSQSQAQYNMISRQLQGSQKQPFHQPSTGYEHEPRQQPIGHEQPSRQLPAGFDQSSRRRPGDFDETPRQNASGFEQSSRQPPSRFNPITRQPQSNFEAARDAPPNYEDHEESASQLASHYDQPSRPPPPHYERTSRLPIEYDEQVTRQPPSYHDKTARKPVPFDQSFRQPPSRFAPTTFKSPNSDVQSSEFPARLDQASRPNPIHHDVDPRKPSANYNQSQRNLNQPLRQPPVHQDPASPLCHPPLPEPASRQPHLHDPKSRQPPLPPDQKLRSPVPNPDQRSREASPLREQQSRQPSALNEPARRLQSNAEQPSHYLEKPSRHPTSLLELPQKSLLNELTPRQADLQKRHLAQQDTPQRQLPQQDPLQRQVPQMDLPQRQPLHQSQSLPHLEQQRQLLTQQGQPVSSLQSRPALAQPTELTAQQQPPPQLMEQIVSRPDLGRIHQQSSSGLGRGVGIRRSRFDRVGSDDASCVSEDIEAEISSAPLDAPSAAGRNQQLPGSGRGIGFAVARNRMTAIGAIGSRSALQQHHVEEPHQTSSQFYSPPDASDSISSMLRSLRNAPALSDTAPYRARPWDLTPAQKLELDASNRPKVQPPDSIPKVQLADSIPKVQPLDSNPKGREEKRPEVNSETKPDVAKEVENKSPVTLAASLAPMPPIALGKYVRGPNDSRYLALRDVSLDARFADIVASLPSGVRLSRSGVKYEEDAVKRRTGHAFIRLTDPTDAPRCLSVAAPAGPDGTRRRRVHVRASSEHEFISANDPTLTVEELGITTDPATFSTRPSPYHDDCCLEINGLPKPILTEDLVSIFGQSVITDPANDIFIDQTKCEHTATAYVHFSMYSGFQAALQSDASAMFPGATLCAISMIQFREYKQQALIGSRPDGKDFRLTSAQRRARQQQGTAGRGSSVGKNEDDGNHSCIEVQNLPLDATTQELRTFFQPLSIPPDAIHLIVRGTSLQAFIQFAGGPVDSASAVAEYNGKRLRQGSAASLTLRLCSLAERQAALPAYTTDPCDAGGVKQHSGNRRHGKRSSVGSGSGDKH